MRFGPVPVAQAEGAILAHSMSLPQGRLRKGHKLERADLDNLRAAGVAEIVVARLDAGDLPEDAAAQRVAEALSGSPGLSLTAPFTGRVNLVADGAGIVELAADAIHAANAVDPMITVATVAPFHQVRAGSLVATIKIISYAVPGAAVARVEQAARGAIRLVRPVVGCASLIVTEIPGSPGLKGLEAIEARLDALGIALRETLTCAHDDAALAATLTRARGDMVLILTASATSDPRDTGPQALRLAGGQVTRVGLPVDPGNLLFLGYLGGGYLGGESLGGENLGGGELEKRPVIGLPGSARSPVLHGVDWVLARVACGLPPSPEAFARMGVGGLLKEIPSRPQPRHPRRAAES